MLASALLLVAVAFHRPWVHEDAFITFRTIDQFVHGNGLRWNIDERVQTFTHPLWMLINIPPYYFIRNYPSTVTTLGLTCTAAALLVIGRRYYHRPAAVLVGLTIPLAASSAFVIFSTSGYENPLSHLCFAFFAFSFFRSRDRGEVAWGSLALAAAFAATNRLDTALVYAPPLAYLLVRHFRDVAWRRFLLGFAPLGAWLLFSTFYYGFPYPNTALAKLNEEFPRVYLVRQGLFFAGDLLVNDPVGFLTIAFGSVLTLKRLAGIVLRRTSRASMELASLGAGALLYSLYVVSIGGTYLSGRHWTMIIFVNAVLCAELLHTVAGRADALSERGDLGAVLSEAAARPAVRITAASGVLAALLILLGGPRFDLSSLGTYREIAKPSAFKFLANDYQWNSSLTAAVFEAKGRVFRESKFGVTSAVGLTAIAAGRDAIIIDRLALTDPLLARFPPRPQLAVLGMMDHFKREVPQGYKVARRSDTLEKMHPELRAYYEPLQRILRDPLFSAERLRTIVDFNLGRYDAHLDAYIEHRRKRGKSFMGSRP